MFIHSFNAGEFSISRQRQGKNNLFLERAYDKCVPVHLDGFDRLQSRNERLDWTRTFWNSCFQLSSQHN